MAHFPICGGHEGAGRDRGGRARRADPGRATTSSPRSSRAAGGAGGARPVQNLCDNGAFMMTGSQLDGTYRMHRTAGHRPDLAGRHLLRATCRPRVGRIEIETTSRSSGGPRRLWRPHRLGLRGQRRRVRPGDVVIVMGIGGIGINAVQGAAHAGASRIIAVDPVALKRESTRVRRHRRLRDDRGPPTSPRLTNGQGADSASSPSASPPSTSPRPSPRSARRAPWPSPRRKGGLDTGSRSTSSSSPCSRSGSRARSSG